MNLANFSHLLSVHGFDPSSPYDVVWKALLCARLFLQQPGARAQFELIAHFQGEPVFVSVVSALLDAVDAPEFELLAWSGTGARVLDVPPLARDIDQGYAWILDADGRLLEHGAIEPDRTGTRWQYRLQRPDDYATQPLISILAVIGPHHVNA